MPYRFDPQSGRYRSTETGRFISRATALAYVDDSLRATALVVDTLATLVSEAQISPVDWRDRFRQEIKTEYIRQYLLGRGGREVMSQADWGSVGGMLKEQYGYLDGFFADIQNRDLTEAQIAARMRMYINSAREAYSRAEERARGLPAGSLPAHPGDGTTICLSNCKCSWEIEDVDGGFNAYWRLGAAEHCETCVDRAAAWSPYFVASSTRSRQVSRRRAPDHVWKHRAACSCSHCLQVEEGGIDGSAGDRAKA